MLKTIKIIFFSLLCTNSLALLISCWYLEPLIFDGARITFTFIDSIAPFNDYGHYRLLLGAFQIPTLVLMGIWKKAGPLFFARFYFLCVFFTLPIFLSYQILKAKSLEDIFNLSFLFFICLLPTTFFPFNVFFETAFFLFFFFMALDKKEVSFQYFFCGFFASLGHPSLCLGFLLILIIQIIEILFLKNAINKPKIILNLIFLGISGGRAAYATILYPGLNSHFPNVIKDFLRHWTSINHYPIWLCLLFCALLLFSVWLKSKKSYSILWISFLFFLLYGLIMASQRDVSLSGHNLRVFGVFFLLFIILWIWIARKVKLISLTYPIIGLMIISIFFSYHRFKRSIESVHTFKEIEALNEPKICNIVDTTPLITKTGTSLPILKLFIDDKRSIKKIYYDSETSKACALCENLSESRIPINCTQNIYFLEKSKNGYFHLNFTH